MSNDFIADLSKEEKIIFAKSLIRLACSDAKIDERERSFINDVIKIYDLKNNMDVLKNKVPEDILINEIKEKVRERKKALYLIKELLIVTNIDEILDDTEISFIEKVAQVLNIEEEKVLQINELILERKLWLYKQSKVMEEA